MEILNRQWINKTWIVLTCVWLNIHWEINNYRESTACYVLCRVSVRSKQSHLRVERSPKVSRAERMRLIIASCRTVPSLAESSCQIQIRQITRNGSARHRSNTEIYRLVSVSYTHLDVYKRQETYFESPEDIEIIEMRKIYANFK